MSLRPVSRIARLLRAAAVVVVVLITALAAGAGPAAADTYVPISGSGSSWAANAISQWINNVGKNGLRVNYSDTGSSKGRTDFLNHSVDFAVSDIPFQFHPTDGSAPEAPAAGSYAYMPVVAGGTSFMYNLTIGGKRVTNLRLSGANLARIFTGAATKWDDPAIAADNPGLTLPAEKIVPVVRSDGSGSSAQFSLWMQNQQPTIWNAYYQRLGRQLPAGETSYWPTVTGMIAQSGDLGVAGYVSQSYGEGAIGYVQYSYALNSKFPVAKMLNKAGYYVEPTPDNVAVALLQAKINTNSADPAVYLTQDLTGVYADADQRTYPMSSYSYAILPTTVQGSFSTAKGTTLGAFAYYMMCQGQQFAPQLGYSPLPINLVTAGFDQIKKIPGVVPQNITVAQCNNPTFTPDGHNALVDKAVFPPACDKLGATQCSTGTGGAPAATTVKPAAQAKAPAGTTTKAAGAAAAGAAAPAPGAAAAAATDVATVDPDTGELVQPGDTTGALAVAAPVSLSADTGWSDDQNLVVLAGALLLALFLAPPLLARRLASRKDSR